MYVDAFVCFNDSKQFRIPPLDINFSMHLFLAVRLCFDYSGNYYPYALSTL